MPGGYAVYTVKKDDTLSQIVDKFIKGTLFDKYYMVDQALTWERVWNDKLNIGLALNRKNPVRMQPGDIVRLPYLGTEIEISIPFGKDMHLALYTGDRYKVQTLAFVPVVDVHMHIQSLHATPLPIMYNTAYYRTYDQAWGSVTQKKIGESRYAMTETTAGNLASIFAHDFGKIGRFSTDLIAKIFMQNASNNELRQSLFWVLKDTEEEVAKYIAKCEKEKKNATTDAGDKLKLADLSVERRGLTQDYYKALTYYFAKKQVFQMACMMPMDLSYAHFWGHHGLPIYVPEEKGDGFYYIDDMQSIACSSLLGAGWWKQINVEDCYEPFFNKDKDPASKSYERYLSHDIDLQKDFKTYVDWVLTDYVSSPEAAKSAYESIVISFDHKKYVTERPDKHSHCQYVKDTYKHEVEKKYKHFVRRVNGDSTERFEDYYLQDAYTAASAFKYPLQLIPFYHYDPRRYYMEGTDLKGKAQKIAEKHAFFNIESVVSNFKDGHGKIADITMSGIDADYIYKNVLSDLTANDKKNPYIINIVRSASCKPHEEIIRKIYPNGPYLGIKLYPALGYPPNHYVNPHHNDTYADRQFENLRRLFEHCEKEKVPVTAHCSPLGMTIADGFNYLFRDWKTRSDKYPIKESALYVDKICGHPDNWADVIRDFPKIKINLAHFGGMQQWNSTEKDLINEYGEKYYNSCVKSWKNKIADLAIANDNVYTDISCYTINSTREVPTMIIDQDMKKILAACDTRQKNFMKASYWLNDDEYTWYIKRGRSDDDKYHIMDLLEMTKVVPRNEKFLSLASGLKEAIKGKPKLKEKILMGSDWYMTEVSGIKGSAVYYGTMFELLRNITKDLGDEYDVWHQFSVVNNLKFLGFLQVDEAGILKSENINGRKVYMWDRKRIKKYLSLLENVKKDEFVLKTGSLNSDNLKNFKTISELRFEQLMYSKIYESDKIKTAENKLLITSIVS